MHHLSTCVSPLHLCTFRLFETEPDLKRLFPKIVRLNEVSQLEMDVDRDMLQRHAVTVMEGLGAAVESLEDSDFLNSVLISIGQTHVRRNVKPQMLKVRSWNTSTSSLDFIRCHEKALELYPFS